jgi:hypothetical protein
VLLKKVKGKLGLRSDSKIRLRQKSFESTGVKKVRFKNVFFPE